MRKKQNKFDVLNRRVKLALFDLLDFVLTKYENLKTSKHSKLFPFLFFAFFLFAQPTFASEQVDINQITSGGVSAFSYHWGQSFKPTKNNITAVEFACYNAVNQVYTINVCKGVASSTNFASTSDCKALGNTLVVATTSTINCGGGAGGVFKVPIGTKYTEVGADYYWTINSATVQFKIGFAGGTSDTYPNGTALPTTQWASYNDLFFKTYYESSYDPAYVVLTSPSQGQRFTSGVVLFEGSIFNPQFAYTNLIIEILNKETWTSLEDINGDIHLSTSSPFSLQVPYTQFTEGNYRAIAYLINQNTGVRSTSTRVDYMLGINTVFSGTSDAQYQTGSALTEAQLCQGIATSTFFGGIECGFKKVIAFAITPNDSTLNNLKNSYINFKNTFPFTAYYQLTDTINGAIASTTLSRNGTFDVPMINKQGHIGTIPILSSNSMPNAIGQTNTTLIRNTITWFMWLAVAFLVFLQFKKL